MEHSKGIIVIFHNGERFVHLIFDVSMNPSDISIYASRKFTSSRTYQIFNNSISIDLIFSNDQIFNHIF